jgi:hypothetical protein
MSVVVALLGRGGEAVRRLFDCIAKVFLQHGAQFSPSCGRGDRIIMWGTTSTDHELTGNFDGAHIDRRSSLVSSFARN